MHSAFSSLHKDLQRGISDLGFEQPTPIQQSAIPHLLEGRDALACAMTGSGKTAAFLLPILHRLLQRKRGKTRALVLAPTRELAAQVVANFNDLARHTRLRAAAVYGGVGMLPQEQAFRRGVDMIVACPGRLLDHFQHDYARLRDLEILVLDEADRMLDMGFLPDIRRVLRHLPKIQQNLLFSATMPRPIVQLSHELLNDPVHLNVERKAAPADGIEQAIFPVRQDLKTRLLLALLLGKKIGNALIFTRTKRRADRLARSLSRKGISSERIHGARTQSQRTRALESFKEGKIQVLVATDIAARGIDVEALSHVVNFDVPNMPEDYIHRVGRTARAGATGEAFTFVAPHEQDDLIGIERAVGQRLKRRFLENFDYDAPEPHQHQTRTAQPSTRRNQQLQNQGGQRPRRTRAARSDHRNDQAPQPATRSERKEGGQGQAKPRRRRRRSGQRSRTAPSI